MTYKYKGTRIKARDQNLVYHLKYFITIDWNMITGIDVLSQIKTVYFWGSIIIALLRAQLLDCFIVIIMWILSNGLNTARMILQNGWYEQLETSQEGFFKGLQHNETKRQISRFPKIYYRMKNGMIHIHVEITMGKYQNQLLRLENKLESGLFYELMEKNLKESYVEYVLPYDTIGSRIGIQDFIAENGVLKLTESLWWEYVKLLHRCSIRWNCVNLFFVKETTRPTDRIQ